MPDREKVIRGLVEISDHMQQVAKKTEDPMLSGMFEYWHEIAEDALALLREQDETRLVRHFSRPGVYADLWLHCEKCGGLVDDRYRYKHCPNCGRAVKWDE